MSQGPPEGPNSGQPDGIQSNELPKDFVLEAGVLKMSRQAFEAIFDQARLLNTRNPADLARITEAFEKHFGETELNMRKRMRDECAREIVQKLAELPDNVSLVECLAYIQAAKSLAAAGDLRATSGLPEEIAIMQHRDNEAVYQTAERLVRARFLSHGDAGSDVGNEPTRPGRNMVKVGSFHIGDGQMDSVSNTGVVGAKIVGPEKASEESTIKRNEMMELFIGSAKLLEDDGFGDFSGICDEHLDDDGKKRFAAIVDEVGRNSMVLYQEEGPETQMTLDDCLAFVERRRKITLSTDALAELPSEVVDPYVARQERIIALEEQTMRAFFSPSPEKAPEAPTIRRKEVIDLMSDVSEGFASPAKKAQFAALCNRHLEGDSMDWMQEIAKDVINNAAVLFTEGNPDDRMNLEACLEFAKRNAEIMIPLNALSELPREVADAYIANNQAVIDACDEAIKERFAELARAAAAQAASTGSTPAGGRVVASTGPIRIEASSNTITREKFLQISKEPNVPTELLNRIFEAIDGSGRSRMTRARFKKACQGVKEKISADLKRIPAHLSLDDCLRLIDKYEKWGTNTKKKYLACCDVSLRRNSEQFDHGTFEQMRKTVKAMFEVTKRAEKDSQPAEVITESGEPTVGHDVLSKIYEDRYDNQLSSAATPLQLVGEMTSTLPDDEGDAIMEAVRQHENATDAVIQGLPAKLTEADCIGAIEIIRNLELTGALAGIKHVAIGDILRKSVDAACDFMAGQVRERFREIGPTISSVKLTDFFRRRREQYSDAEEPAAEKVQQLMEQLSDDEAVAVMAEVETRGEIVNQILSNLPDRITLAECLNRINLLRAVQPTGVLLEGKYTEIREALGAGSRATYDQLEVEVREAFEALKMGTISKDDLSRIYGEALMMYVPIQSDVDEVKQIIVDQPANIKSAYERACTVMQDGVERLFQRLPGQITQEHIDQVVGAFRMGQTKINENNQFFPEELVTRLRLCTDNTITGFECRARAALIHAGICRDAKNIGADEPTIESDDISQILGDCLNAPMELTPPSPQDMKYIDRIVAERKRQVVSLYASLPERLNLELCLRTLAMFQTIGPVEIYNIVGADQAQVLISDRNGRYAKAIQVIRQRFPQPEAAKRTIAKKEFSNLTDKARVGYGLNQAEHEQAFEVLTQKVPGFASSCTAANRDLLDGYDVLPDPVTKDQCLEFLKLLEAASRPIIGNADHLPKELADKIKKVYDDNRAALKKAVDDFFAPVPAESAEDGRITAMPEQVFLQHFTIAMDNCSQEHEQLLERLTNQLSEQQADKISQLLEQDINEMVRHCSNDGQAFTEVQCYELLDWMRSRLLKQENTTYKQASPKWKKDWKQYANGVMDQVTTITDNWFAGPGGARESLEIAEADGPVCILKSEFISIWHQEFTPPEGGINADGLSTADTKDSDVQKCVETLRLTVEVQMQIVEDMPPFITVARFCKFIDEIQGAIVSLDSKAKQVNRPAINKIVAHYQAHLATFRHRMRARFGIEQESGGLAIGSARFGKSLPDGLQASAGEEPEGQIPLLSFNSLFDNCVTASRKAVPPPSMEQLPQGSREEWESFTLGFKTYSNQCVSNIGDWLGYSECKKLIRQLRERCLKVRAVNVMKVVPRKFAKLIDDRQIYAINEVERRLPELFGDQKESSESAETQEPFRTSKVLLIQLMKQTESEYKSSAITRTQGQLFADADEPVQKQIIAARDKSIGAVEDLRDELPVLVSLSECNEYLLHHRNHMRLTHYVEGPPLPDEIAQSSDDSENEMLDKIIAKLPDIFEADKLESKSEPKGTVSIQEFNTLLSSVDADSHKKHAQTLGKALERLSPALQEEANVVSDSKIAAIQKFRENTWAERLTFAVCKHYCRYAAMGFPPRDFGNQLPPNFCKLLRRIDRDMYGEIEKGLPELFRKHAKVESADTAQAVSLDVTLLSNDEIEALINPPTISKTEFKRMIAGVAGMADSVMSVPKASDLTDEEKQTHARRTAEELDKVLSDYPNHLTEAQCIEMINRLHNATAIILQEFTIDGA